MSAENEIRDINLFGDIKRIKQDLFDAVHPIGEIYVQYPQQDDPMTIYNKNGVTSVWEEQLQYNGAFFRSSNAVSTIWGCDDLPDEYFLIDGSNNITPARVVAENGGGVSIGAATGNTRTIDEKVYKEYSVTGYSTAAAGYINKTNVLSIQEQRTAKNGLTLRNQNSDSATQNKTSSDGEHRHDVLIYTGDSGSISNIYPGSMLASNKGNTNPKEYRDYYFYEGSFGPILKNGGSHSHSIYLRGDAETRPINYTFVIWKRIN